MDFMTKKDHNSIINLLLLHTKQNKKIVWSESSHSDISRCYSGTIPLPGLHLPSRWSNFIIELNFTNKIHPPH